MYAKLFTTMYQGTLRGNAHALLVFTNLLAHCDKHGIVDMHPRAIAEEVGLSEGEVRAALLELEAPDPESRSPDFQGKRIVRLDEHRAWGWQVVNFLKYRAIRNEDDRREQNRLAQAAYRNRSKQSKPPSAAVSLDQPQSAHTEADTEKNTPRASLRSADLLPDGLPKALAEQFITYRKAKRAPLTRVAWDGIKREAEKAGWRLCDAVTECMERDWRAFRADWVKGKSAPAAQDDWMRRVI